MATVLILCVQALTGRSVMRQADDERGERAGLDIALVVQNKLVRRRDIV